jgi:hypothetical protein
MNFSDYNNVEIRIDSSLRLYVHNVGDMGAYLSWINSVFHIFSLGQITSRQINPGVGEEMILILQYARIEVKWE